ncbi:MAG: hypothetical protein D6723_07740 [Acidobacteria bacterium]|nr:MAG: hypothetical protein D6723_07740 [Acidobacteriota bacterium]
MSAAARRMFFWTPRILGILFALVMSLFALDVFGEGYGFGEAILAFLIHLIPTSIVVIALLIAWRWEWIGAILFGTLAAFYMGWSWGRFPLATSLFISGPLSLIGVLFLFDWMYRARSRMP